MIPRDGYIITWFLKDGKTIQTLSNLGAFEEWRKDPKTYRFKRLARFNNHRGRLAPAVDMVICKYTLIGEPHGDKVVG